VCDKVCTYIAVCCRCSAGKYSAAAASVCTSCEAGKFSGATGQTSSVTCTDCMTAGKYSAAAASVCTDCTAGKYQSAAPASVCTSCAAGKFSGATGQTSSVTCTDCTAGTYSAAAASVCTSCEAGKYKAASGVNTACDICEAGKYRQGSCHAGNNGVVRLVGCTSVACRLEVQYQQQWGTVCDYLFSDTDAAVACRSLGLPTAGAVAQRSFGGGSGPIWMDRVECIGSELDIAQCPKRNSPPSFYCGHYADVGVCCKVAAVVCDNCTAGSHSGAGAKSCIGCLAGKYSSVQAASTSDTCMDCDAGKFSRATGQTSSVTCIDCTAGSHSGAGAISCIGCLAGKYSSVQAASTSDTCVDCAAGKLSRATGQTSSVTCIDSCEAGKFSGATGQTEYVTSCIDCTAGKYSAAGAAVCTDCAAGKLSAAVGATSASTCAECGAGKYGDASAATVCTDCVPGKYKATAGVNTACDNCEAGKFKASAGVNTACDNCEAGKYSASSSTVCADCGTGTYSNVSGSPTCLECTKEPCPFPGTFELSSCTRQADKVCQVYVHNVPTIGKIFIACGQVPFVVLTCFVVVKISKKLRSAVGVGANWKWAVFSLFVIGVYDVVSDLTTLALIPMKNPFFLFHVSLASLGCSVAASLVLSFYSSIKLSWPTRAFIFITGTAGDFGKDRPEKWNSRVLLCVENLPQLAVQAILLYLQGSQGFTGWDWAILVQALLFTLLNIVIRIRKLGKDLWERMDQGISAASEAVAAV
jgi:hypothetical protein